jgi:glyoxalase family protein
MPGIHHVTAISGDPVRNLRFYTRDLGLRLVKKTVNFDDPSTYHFYFGDRTGHPGTILTFFPGANATAGQRGVGQASRTAFRVPLHSIGYWTKRLIEKGVSHQAPEKRFGETVLPFADQDGTALAFVGIADAENEPGWTNGEIPAEHAIRGLQGVTLLLENAPKTAAILTDVFGLSELTCEGSVIRFASAGDARGAVVDLHEAAGFPRHHRGRGSVHHIAFRAADDAQLAEMSEKLIHDHGRHPTEKKDRNYFRSIYFREPGGVLFEIATDIPGFAIDEPVDALGRDLKLPRFLESRRVEIESQLPLLENMMAHGEMMNLQMQR